MKIPLILTLLFTVVNKGSFAQAQGTKLTGFSGGGIIVKCDYKERHRAYMKTFCKLDEGLCKFSMTPHDNNKHFMLYDTDRNHFLVLMRNLTVQDSGMYQCRVEENLESQNRTFYLEVKEDPCCGHTMTQSVIVGKSTEISCKYPGNMRGNAKDFYKQHPEMILSDVFQAKQSTRDDATSETFKVTIRNLALADAGVYWCAMGTGGSTGSRVLIKEVTLRVFDPKTPPTSSSTNLDSSQPTNNQPPLERNALPIVSVTLAVLVTGLTGVVFCVCQKRRKLAGKSEHNNSTHVGCVYEEINDPGCPSDPRSSTTDPAACHNYATVTFHKGAAESPNDSSSAFTPKVEMTSEYATIQPH